MNHAMVDIETLGNKPGCVITSISAVQFDLNGNIGKTFNRNINIQSSIMAGLWVDGGTVEWWLKQDKQAQEMLFNPPPMALYKVLEEFTAFVFTIPQVSLWGNSARFDLGILEAAYLRIGQKPAWEHNLERDVRTIVALNPIIKKEMPFEGIKHYGVDDCIHQIKYITQTLKSIGYGI